MNVKKQHLMGIVLISIVLIVSNLSNTNSVSAFVSAGNNFHYISDESILWEVEYLDGESGYTESYSVEMTEDIHIIEVNSYDKTILYKKTTEYGENNYTAHYDWETYAIDYFEFDDLFYIYYVWDYVSEKPILRSFDFNFRNMRFISNNWSIINAYFVDLFDAYYIVDTVTDPVHLNDYEITFGYFLESINSFKIQGRNSLGTALSQFGSQTTKWTFEFDLSGVIYYNDHFDDELGYNIYLPIDKCIYKSIIEYTPDGALKHREDYFDIEIEYFTDRYKEAESVYFIYTLEKYPALLDFYYLAVFPSIIFIVYITRLRSKKVN
ncbi:MAG: hypothetical protein FK734_08540 [Asgard group archaeon]|nr:hypothetical protein [Asgard group archaeon]